MHVVHSDDPRNTYVDADIVIEGEAHGPYMGSGPYNLYNNRMLEIVPDDVWVAFLDDDDEYTAPDVFQRLIDDNQPNTMHTGQVSRWADKIWNTDPNAKKKEFQTECFAILSNHAKRAKWWGDRSGDHYYTRQLTRTTKTRWHEVLIARAQEDRKGNGERVDVGHSVVDWDNLIGQDDLVYVKLFSDVPRVRGGQGGHLVQIRYRDAREIEKAGVGIVTFRGTNICSKIAD